MTEMIGKTLNMLDIGQRALVIQVKGKGGSRKRLLDMGMVPGTIPSVIKKAPLGDPVDFKLKGYNLSLSANSIKYVWNQGSLYLSYQNWRSC